MPQPAHAYAPPLAHLLDTSSGALAGLTYALVSSTQNALQLLLEIGTGTFSLPVQNPQRASRPLYTFLFAKFILTHPRSSLCPLSVPSADSSELLDIAYGSAVVHTLALVGVAKAVVHFQRLEGKPAVRHSLSLMHLRMRMHRLSPCSSLSCCFLVCVGWLPPRRKESSRRLFERCVKTLPSLSFSAHGPSRERSPRLPRSPAGCACSTQRAGGGSAGSRLRTHRRMSTGSQAQTGRSPRRDPRLRLCEGI